MNLAELMEQTARSLAAARDVFGPAPQDPAWTTGGDLSAGRDAVAGAGQQASGWGGETANNYAANNQGQQTALTGVQETDAKTGPLGTAVGQAAASGRDEINGVIRDTQTGVAALAPASTPDQQTALAEHLRHQLKRAKAILRAYQAKGAQLASQMRQTGMGYGGIGQGMGGMGGIMPPQGMSGPGGSGLGTLPRGHHYSGVRSVAAHHSTTAAPDARSLGASRPAQAAVQAALTRLGAPYVWGAKGPNQFDCLAAGTVVTTMRGEVPIEALTSSDQVLTRQGYRRVIAAWKVRDDAPVITRTIAGRSLIGTADHRVWTENRGWVALEGINNLDTLAVCHTSWSSGSADSAANCSQENQRGGFAVNGAATSATPRPPRDKTVEAKQNGSISKESHTTDTQSLPGHRSALISSDQASRCTSRYGNTEMVGQCRKGTKSITTTTTPSTMIRPTWSWSPSPTIAGKARRAVAYITMSAHSAVKNFRHHERRAAPTASAAATTPKTTATATVYDVMVEGVHEFFANGVLVHNCSGLTHWAYAQAGITIGGDTYTQINDGAPVAPSDVQAGDLIFPDSGHVMLAINGHEVVEAQDFGVPVKISPMPSSFVARRPWPGIPV